MITSYLLFGICVLILITWIYCICNSSEKGETIFMGGMLTALFLALFGTASIAHGDGYDRSEQTFEHEGRIVSIQLEEGINDTWEIELLVNDGQYDTAIESFSTTDSDLVDRLKANMDKNVTLEAYHWTIMPWSVGESTNELVSVTPNK